MGMASPSVADSWTDCPCFPIPRSRITGNLNARSQDVNRALQDYANGAAYLSRRGKPTFELYAAKGSGNGVVIGKPLAISPWASQEASRRLTGAGFADSCQISELASSAIIESGDGTSLR